MIHIQSKQDIQIPRENNNILEYFKPKKDKKYILNKQDIKGDHKDFIGKSLDTESRVRDSLSRRIL